MFLWLAETAAENGPTSTTLLLAAVVSLFGALTGLAGWHAKKMVENARAIEKLRAEWEKAEAALKAKHKEEIKDLKIATQQEILHHEQSKTQAWTERAQKVEEMKDGHAADLERLLREILTAKEEQAKKGEGL